MARPIILSNGELHVGINAFGLVHDFYYPYVGLENHAAGQSLRHKVGVWINDTISWLDEPGWDVRFRAAEYALVGHTIAKNEELGVLLEFDDFVDASMSVFMRNVHIVNLWNERREIRLFMHQAFVIGDTRSNTDTAQYLPDSDAILHYHGRRAFVVSARDSDGKPFDQHTIGLFGIEGHEGTFRDADDGELMGGNVEHGRVDSTVRFKLSVEGHSSVRVHYWISAGTSMREALFIHRHVQGEGLLARLQQTIEWWQEWLEPAETAALKLPEQYRREFIRSAMIIKSHIDKRGAIIASTDTSMLNYSRDAYAYCWPRDSAYVLWPLMRLGYESEPRRFFEFCRRGLHPSGYLMHKYQADGAIGSSWHPYVHGSMSAPPIQEDETALVLFMFAQFYHLHPTKALLDEFYDSFVKRMADFMASYTEETTHLPRPSYDLWEENFLTTTYTTATVYAALEAAAELAEVADDKDSAVKWRTAADDIRQAARKYLYNRDRKSFYKAVTVVEGAVEYNDVVDTSAFFGAFMYGLFDVESEEVASTFATIKNIFGKDSSVGLPRYEHDEYHRLDSSSLGNWWIITTLWSAQYYIETGEKDKAKEVIDWVLSLVPPTGILSEQVNPKDSTMMSVAPLAWSHAEYMATLLDLITDTKNDGSKTRS